MKCKFYLRIAKGKKGALVRADIRPNFEPIHVGNYRKQYYPTVLAELELDIPDSEFSASRIALKTKIESTIPCVEIKQLKEAEKDVNK